MTTAIPPLPAPLEGMSGHSARPGLSVESLPVTGNNLPPEAQQRTPLPELGNFARFTAEETPVTPKTPPMPNPSTDYTDEDLRQAIAPLVASAMTGEFRDDASLEAMLRSTFRRALAEHQTGPFQKPGVSHRIAWHLQALFTSRTYDEVLSDKIRRFHVEEVYLLDRDKLSLISYASSDPVRHAHPRKVGSFARQLALRVRDDSGALMLGFELGEGRRTLVRCGQFCLLVAVIYGDINDLVKADLDFALKRVETRYRIEFVQGHPLLQELQPLLEECLLIHSPAGPVAT